jgi:hypothetical protein
MGWLYLCAGAAMQNTLGQVFPEMGCAVHSISYRGG